MTRTLYLFVALLLVTPREARAVFINEVMTSPGQFGAIGTGTARVLRSMTSTPSW